MQNVQNGFGTNLARAVTKTNRKKCTKDVTKQMTPCWQQGRQSYLIADTDLQFLFHSNHTGKFDESCVVKAAGHPQMKTVTPQVVPLVYIHPVTLVGHNLITRAT